MSMCLVTLHLILVVASCTCWTMVMSQMIRFVSLYNKCIPLVFKSLQLFILVERRSIT